MKTLNLDAEVINKSKTMGDKVESLGEPEVETPTRESQRPANKKSSRRDRFVRFLSKCTSFPKRLFLNFQALPPTKKLITTFVICGTILIAGGIAGYIIITNERTPNTFTFPTRVTADAPTYQTFTSLIPLSVPNEPRTTPNPINGELYTKKEFAEMQSRFPLAVIIENQVQARPQSGYNSADIVFETLAEGGITRSMAVFWGRKISEIGPIRSARVYFIEWAKPFDPLIMHIGYAISDDERIDVSRMIYNRTFRSLDRGGTFWRSPDRFAPHNAYSSSDLLYEKAQTYGLTGTPGEIETWQFKQDAPLDERGDITGTKIVFFERLNNGGLYDITWNYDRERNVYLRYNNDTPYTDENTGEIVYAKNVIIQRLSVVSAYDEKAHMIVTTIGTGDAIILRDGQAIYGTWRKESSEKRTRYYDADGNEITFNRGVTWVEAVPTDLGSVQVTP